MRVRVEIISENYLILEYYALTFSEILVIHYESLLVIPHILNWRGYFK